MGQEKARGKLRRENAKLVLAVSQRFEGVYLMTPYNYGVPRVQCVFFFFDGNDNSALGHEKDLGTAVNVQRKGEILAVAPKKIVSVKIVPFLIKSHKASPFSEAKICPLIIPHLS
jgi:hypothetical protein